MSSDSVYSSLGRHLRNIDAPYKVRRLSAASHMAETANLPMTKRHTKGMRQGFGHVQVASTKHCDIEGKEKECIAETSDDASSSSSILTSGTPVVGGRTVEGKERLEHRKQAYNTARQGDWVNMPPLSSSSLPLDEDEL